MVDDINKMFQEYLEASAKAKALKNELQNQLPYAIKVYRTLIDDRPVTSNPLFLKELNEKRICDLHTMLYIQNQLEK